MRVCGPEWVFRNAAHAVWSRRRAIFCAVSAASVAGNFIVLAGLLEVQWGALAGSCGLLFYDNLPQLLELLVHRPALFILLNLILVKIVVESGLVGRVPMPEDSPPDNYVQIDSKMHWPATFQVAADALNDFPDTETTLPAPPSPTLCELPVPNYTTSTPAVNIACTEPPAVTRSCRLPSNSPVAPQASADVYERFAVRSMKKPLLELQLPSDSITAQQSAQRASLFTIEPLDVVTDHHHQLHGAMITQLVGGGKLERPETSPDPHAQEYAVPAPLRKVGTRAAILHDLSSLEESCGHSHDDQIEALQVVKYDPDAAAAHEQLDDNELSRQEFKQRVDTFIFKFKRSLTMQREDSLNRLLGLLGGGEIRLIK